MRIKFMRTAIVAGTAAVAGLATASPALAAPVPTVQVPCRVSALASAISGASNGAVLRLASCTYVLTSELPMITHEADPAGQRGHHHRAPLRRRTPHFSLLSVGTGGNLTVTNVNFNNGYAVDEGGAIDGEDGPVSVTGGTFTGNYAAEYGGAIWNDDGLTVTGATFTGNSAADYGGAIDSEDDATISGSTFTGNTSEYGGALENDADVTLSNSTFTSNSSSEYGGAFYDDGGITTVNKGTFMKNSSVYGGAIEDEGDGIVVNNSYFQQNTATSEGGAIADYEAHDAEQRHLQLQPRPRVRRCRLHRGWRHDPRHHPQGQPGHYGGGLYNDDDMTLTGSSFTNNSAVYGGGMYNEDEATVDGTTFQQNSASTAGGGIYEDGTFAHLYSSRVMFNHAPSGEGGGIYNEGHGHAGQHHGPVQHREQLLPGPLGPGLHRLSPAPANPYTSPGPRLTARSRTGSCSRCRPRSAPGALCGLLSPDDLAVEPFGRGVPGRRDVDGRG